MELHEIIEVKWVKGYKVQITFNNLKKAVVDLEKFLGKGIFKELKSIKKFKQLRVDSELGTIVWPNGADIAPEVLYQEALLVKHSSRLSNNIGTVPLGTVPHSFYVLVFMLERQNGSS